ncbi:uncharacterized protein LOC125652817 [Ostrea edulis]|uniref:uncharacterized protein LOC125652817 n=1 Tax=Ostrea edulis TaxID=37623 RepID=UPI0020941E63|nr:uncharacterized protein LOC125652817 [Ostrea edulis]XP_048738191.1 uncharacterized protein LOC125652817 [Ostrea edulis]
MGIDLYEVDIRSLNPMRWLTDAVIDVVARRMKEQIPSKNVYILETFFAQKLLVKGKLNRRPLDMTGCNYLGVENVLAALDVDLEKGAILIVPISNMFHNRGIVLTVGYFSFPISETFFRTSQLQMLRIPQY